MKLAMFLLLFAVISFSGVFAAGDEPPVGFVCHYPFINVGMDELPKSGASALNTRAPMGAIEPEEGKFDFSSLDAEISYAEQHGLKLVLLLECNPVYCPEWLKKKVTAAGQMQKFDDGRDHKDPSITSSVFAEASKEFIRRTIEYVKQRDTKRVITHYSPGAEWWFEHKTRYNPEDVLAFRKWLASRYVEIGNLNVVWGSNYTSFEEVPAPRIDLADYGHMKGLSRILSVEVPIQDCSWSTRQGHAVNVTPGKTYTFTAWAKTENVVGRGAHLSASWLAKGSDVPFHMDYSPGLDGDNDWQKLSLTVTAPKSADRVWLLLKLAGFGTAVFDEAIFTEEGSSRNLLVNSDFEAGNGQPEAWFFDNWIGGEGISGEYLRSGGREDTRCVRISIPHPSNVNRTYTNQSAAVTDWCYYWQETGADYIDEFAALVKSFDNSRPTVSYLTYAFAFPVEWDYVTANAIATDEVASRAENLDILGLQICSADGDPFRVTANLDIARKYRKPVWAIDLLDWTRGVRIGYSANAKVAQSAVQHGARGIFHYCWHGTPDYDFYPDMAIEDMHRMLTDTREGIKLLRGMAIRPKVALIEPILPASPEDETGFKNDYRSFFGWYKILKAMHITFDVVTLREIHQGITTLSGYDWVLVPDCACIPKPVYLRLARYAWGRGWVVTSGRFAESDEFGRPFKPALTGLGSRMIRLPDYGRDYAGVMYRNTYAGNTPPLFIWRKETPEVAKVLASARDGLKEFFTKAGITPEVEFSPESSGISCVMHEGFTRAAAYLVNMANEPAEGITLRIRRSGVRTVTVYADMKPIECKFQPSEGSVEISLPKFETSCIVFISG